MLGNFACSFARRFAETCQSSPAFLLVLKSKEEINGLLVLICSNLLIALLLHPECRASASSCIDPSASPCRSEPKFAAAQLGQDPCGDWSLSQAADRPVKPTPVFPACTCRKQHALGGDRSPHAHLAQVVTRQSPSSKCTNEDESPLIQLLSVLGNCLCGGFFRRGSCRQKGRPPYKLKQLRLGCLTSPKASDWVDASDDCGCLTADSGTGTEQA